MGKFNEEKIQFLEEKFSFWKKNSFFERKIQFLKEIVYFRKKNPNLVNEMVN